MQEQSERPSVQDLHQSDGAMEPQDSGHNETTILAGPRRRPLAGRNALVLAAEELSYRVAQVTALLALLLTFAVVGSLLLQVFFRYVLDAPLAWTDELAIFFFAWLMLLLATLGVRERSHVRFTFIINALPARISGGLDIVITLLIVGFGVVLVTTGADLLELVWGNLSPAVHYPLQALYFVLPIVGVLMVLHAVTNLLIGPAVPGRAAP